MSKQLKNFSNDFNILTGATIHHQLKNELSNLKVAYVRIVFVHTIQIYEVIQIRMNNTKKITLGKLS